MRGNAFGGELKSYGTSEFVRLHALFGQPPAEYARDWSDTHEALRSGKLVPKQEATGRSGSLFLKTVRSRFILKTIPQSECLSLRQCLSSYTAFLHRHPHSLLMRFFGLHRYTRNTKVLYICIMNNFFYDPPASPLAALPLSCIYDLKARFHGPHVVHLAAFPPRPSDSSPAPDPGTVLRDDQIDRPFPVSEKLRAFLLAQIARDIAWLASHQFMDYSLLIGVKPMTPEPHLVATFQPPPAPAQPRSVGPSGPAPSSLLSGYQAPPGSKASFVPKSDQLVRCRSDSIPREHTTSPPDAFRLLSMRGDEVFYLGVIDILTQWSSKKVIAHQIKKTQTNVKALSTVDPAYYASRWEPFLKEIFPLDFILL